jgi:hypothetical protein
MLPTTFKGELSISSGMDNTNGIFNSFVNELLATDSLGWDDHIVFSQVKDSRRLSSL